MQIPQLETPSENEIITHIYPRFTFLVLCFGKYRVKENNLQAQWKEDW